MDLVKVETGSMLWNGFIVCIFFRMMKVMHAMDGYVIVSIVFLLRFATSQVFSLCEVSARAEVCVIGWGGGQFRRYLSAGAAADTAVVFLLFVPCRVGRGVI
jgi:hypothetical protein